MQNVFLAFAVMTVSAFVAVQVGQRAGKSKTYIYALGLAIMLIQIAALTGLRDWHGNQTLIGTLSHHSLSSQSLMTF